MATEQVSEEEFPYHLLFKPLVSPPPETDEGNLGPTVMTELKKWKLACPQNE